jgi:hypothetical protein
MQSEFYVAFFTAMDLFVSKAKKNSVFVCGGTGTKTSYIDFIY